MKLKSRRRFILLGLATLIAIIVDALAAKPTKADWPYYFIQLTCVPELQFFSVQSLMIYNTFGPWNSRHWNELEKLQEPARQQKRLELLRSDHEFLQHAYGYYFVESLQDAPYRCALGPRLQIEVTGDYTQPSDGMCKGVGSGAIQLRVNGRTLETATVYGGCDESTFRIEMDNGGYRLCRTTFESGNWTTECRNRSLD